MFYRCKDCINYCNKDRKSVDQSQAGMTYENVAVCPTNPKECTHLVSCVEYYKPASEAFDKSFPNKKDKKQ